MKYWKPLFTLLLLWITSVNLAEAHAIWIEASPIANKNQPQTVKIFYGEYANAEIEPTQDWYSDLKTIEVWLISPSQKKTKLTLSDQKTFLQAEFTPEEDGTYFVSTEHAAKDLGGQSKYVFSSVIPVQVGKSPSQVKPASALAVTAQAKTFTLKDDVTLQVTAKGIAAANAEVLVMSASGWSKTFKTDQNGTINFKPLWKGNYVIETSTYQEQAGKWNDKGHTHVWQGSTTFIQVK
ncbi:DUF4198 domain-containing protein [Sphingobacterium hungaricum]|uniref:Nickel transport complex protein, NikM subunit, transmembrane n=1 Tax=Sphingobacterium hungaricum TaxID=2082723 RepID=A0A928UZK6_9SPHI|nr:DUF4198 domain-containing protein [Sphingobacterium hungaricum]MBE8714335.1 nickel transport complex protein, NikM subunit, transmembrane [Sphingobacterium hungaricum]